MVERERDLEWEALVRATHANPAMERGRLNAALKAIREAAMTEGLHPDSLAAEIELRAQAYRERWPHLTLTPTSLATHWFRIVAQAGPVRTGEEQALDRLRRRT